MKSACLGITLLLTGCHGLKNAQSIELDTMFFDIEATFYEDDRDTTTIEEKTENGTIRKHWNWGDRLDVGDQSGSH